MPTSFRFETFRTLSPGRELAGEETPKCFEQLFCICGGKLHRNQARFGAFWLTNPSEIWKLVTVP